MGCFYPRLVLYYESLTRCNRKRTPGSAINQIMQTQIEDSIVTQKTKELCQAILDQPEFKSMRQKIETFMADEKTRSQYDALMVKGQTLQQKQQSGLPLDGAEVNDFEQLRESFLGNPIARGFLDAQEDMHKMQQTVSQMVSKTFELGRVPEESDLDSGCCGGGGGGCGCSH
jgi:cell fate (sporulation/competence/biofilm development) regulator YlbF (YheA/YmcA/DUF963 family)